MHFKKIQSIFILVILLFISCTKPPTIDQILGKYTAQDINSPFGESVELKSNGVCTICNSFSSCQDFTFTLTNSRIAISNGNVAISRSAFQIVFTKSVYEFNPNYIDANGDGIDDYNSNTHQFDFIDHEYVYKK
jgi:hypothetical protein